MITLCHRRVYRNFGAERELLAEKELLSVMQSAASMLAEALPAA